MPSAGLRSSDDILHRLKPFLKRHPNLSVELRLIPWARGWSEIVQGYKHHDLPDVLQVGSSWIATLAHLRVLAAVPEGVQTRRCIAPWVDGMAVHNGVQVAVPWLLECSVMAVRARLLERAGLDSRDLSDWDSFYESCLRLSRDLSGQAEQRAVPLIAHSRPEYNTLHWAMPWLWSGGWRPFDPLSSPFHYLSDPSAIPGFSYIAKLFQISPRMREVADAPAGRIYADFFGADRYAIYLGPSDAVMRIRAGKEGAHQFPIVPIPKGPGGAKTRAGGSWLCVSRHSKHRTAAWELVKYMTQDPFLHWRAEAGGEFPALESEYWHSPHDPQRTLLRSILETATTYPRHPLWRTLEHTLMQGISQIFWQFVQGRSYDDEIRRIAARLDESLARLISLGWEISA